MSLTFSIHKRFAAIYLFLWAAFSLSAVEISFDPAGYVGHWSTAGASGPGAKTWDAAPGTHPVAIGREGVGSISISQAGVITTATPDSLEIDGQTVRLKTVDITINPAAYEYSWNIEWVIGRTGASVERLVKGQPYLMRIGDQALFKFRVDAGGHVTTTASDTAEGIASELRFKTAQITIDPGAYSDQYHLGWILDAVGSRTLSLPCGLPYHIRIGYAGSFYFRVEAEGTLSTLNPASVEIAGQLLRFKTQLVTLDPGLLSGGYIVLWVRQTSGVTSLNLVKGLRYLLQIGYAGGFWITLGETGEIVVDNPLHASASGATVTFNTVPVHISPVGFDGAYNLLWLDNFPPGPALAHLVPGLPYMLTFGPQSIRFNLGASPCEIYPAELLFSSGARALLSCESSPTDALPPLLTLPLAIAVEAAGPGGAMVHFTASAHGDVDGEVSVLLDPPSGTLFPLGTSTVSAQAVDSAGNTSTGSFLVTVVDTTPPALLGVTDIEVLSEDGQGANVTFAISAADLVDGPVNVQILGAAGSYFPIGDTILQAVATDSRGNSVTAAFTVKVRPLTVQTIQQELEEIVTQWIEDEKIPQPHGEEIITIIDRIVEEWEAGDPRQATDTIRWFIPRFVRSSSGDDNGGGGGWRWGFGRGWGVGWQLDWGDLFTFLKWFTRLMRIIVGDPTVWIEIAREIIEAMAEAGWIPESAAKLLDKGLGFAAVACNMGSIDGILSGVQTFTGTANTLVQIGVLPPDVLPIINLLSGNITDLFQNTSAYGVLHSLRARLEAWLHGKLQTRQGRLISEILAQYDHVTRIALNGQDQFDQQLDRLVQQLERLPLDPELQSILTTLRTLRDLL